MLHAHVGISLTYLLPGGSPKQINESTASTPLCKFTVLVCPSFVLVTQLAVSGKYISRVSPATMFALPMCTSHRQKTEAFPSTFNFWDKDLKTTVQFKNIYIIFFICHICNKHEYWQQFLLQISALFTVLYFFPH